VPFDDRSNLVRSDALAARLLREPRLREIGVRLEIADDVPPEARVPHPLREDLRDALVVDRRERVRELVHLGLVPLLLAERRVEHRRKDAHRRIWRERHDDVARVLERLHGLARIALAHELHDRVLVRERRDEWRDDVAELRKIGAREHGLRVRERPVGLARKRPIERHARNGEALRSQVRRERARFGVRLVARERGRHAHRAPSEVDAVLLGLRLREHPPPHVVLAPARHGPIERAHLDAKRRGRTEPLREHIDERAPAVEHALATGERFDVERVWKLARHDRIGCALHRDAVVLAHVPTCNPMVAYALPARLPRLERLLHVRPHRLRERMRAPRVHETTERAVRDDHFFSIRFQIQYVAPEPSAPTNQA
jgi:hypothetical protein